MRLYPERDSPVPEGPAYMIRQRLEERAWDAGRKVGNEPDLFAVQHVDVFVPAIIRLHLLWRVHPEEVEAAAEHGLCGGAQGEAAGADVGVFDQHAVDRVELMEARGQHLQVGWDRMHLAPGGGVLDHAREVE